MENEPSPQISMQPQESASTPPVPNQKDISTKAIVLIGFALMVVVAVASLLLIKPKAPEPTPPPVPETTTSPSTQALTLTLTSPTDNELAVNQEILVKGQTLPKSTVVVYTENDESSLEADATGRFETTIGLVDGINQLVVTVFADDGQEKTVTTDVVYEAET